MHFCSAVPHASAESATAENVRTSLHQYSESESLEDEVGHSLSLASALGVAESILELGLESLAGLLASHGVLESLVSDDVLEVEVLLDGEAGGEQVGVVDVLDERLDLRLAVELLLGHSLGDLLGGALDAGDKGVAELAVLLALIDLLDNDSLLARVSACEQDHDAASLHTNMHGRNRLNIRCPSPDMPSPCIRRDVTSQLFEGHPTSQQRPSTKTFG
mmetsp:Transcript_5896/g.7990  ORF Transcript_5896/g.7990 Transcript_5896/m.7990 type:complete len:218 (-) Transcript_5896:154-807(-)